MKLKFCTFVIHINSDIFMQFYFDSCESSKDMHSKIDQLFNDANMVGVDAMCSGYDTSELSEVCFVFVH